MLAMTVLAQANDDVVSIDGDQCSGERTTTTTDTVLQIECTGDFSLAGTARIVSDKRVVIYGHHLLLVAGEVSVTAPVLEFRSDALVNMTGSVEAPNAAFVVNAIGGTVIAASTLKLNAASTVMNTIDGGLPPPDGAGGAVAIGDAGIVGPGTSPPVVTGLDGTQTLPAPVVEVAASGTASGGGGALGWVELMALAAMALLAVIRPVTGA